MTAGGGAPPLVTVGIPLYRAAAFVEGIVHNVESIVYPNLEFLISDRHGLDDAVRQLRARLGSDRRVRFFEATDALPWFDNYNFLLREATGVYFRLLAQDDRILPESLSAAVAYLEAERDAVVAVGPVDVIDAEGRSVVRDRRRARWYVSWRWAESLGVFGGWRHPGGNLGLVRRAVAIEHGLFIPPTHGSTGLSVRAWLFGLSLHGRFGFVPAYVSQRRLHAGSFTSRQPRRAPVDEWRRLSSYVRAGWMFWRRRATSLAERLSGPPVLFAIGILLLPAARLVNRFSPDARRLRKERLRKT